METALVLGGLAAGPLLASYAVEALRSPPSPPGTLAWAPDIPLRYLDLDGTRVRYIVAGEGPPIVLLHTLRTQLDLFQRVLHPLARHHRVYALDYPGHGWSDIPAGPYSPELFVTAAGRFLDRLGIRRATVVGESIGGSIALLLAARPDLVVQAIRGNVDTRLRKLAGGDCDAIVLAAAGLDRLGFGDRISERLDPKSFVPAIGQGILALETRAGDEDERAHARGLGERQPQGYEAAERVADEGGPPEIKHIDEPAEEALGEGR